MSTITDLEDHTTLLRDTGCHVHGQGYRREQVLTVRGPGIRKKVRLTFNRGNNDAQSRYYAEVWTDLGWTEVVRIAGEDPRVTESAGMPSYVSMRHTPDSTARHTVTDCEAWTSRVLDTLLAETLDILT